jgi:large subunit ribosomal protein L23
MAQDLKTKYSKILLRPRVTEKASFIAEKGVYAFEIASTASKPEVSAAVRAYFGVTPLKVRIVRNPAKRVIIRGKRGVKPGVKKAYVYLKEGDKINQA